MTPVPRDAVRTAIEVAISLAMISLLLVACFRIIEPFLSIIVWGTVIAVAVSTPVAKLQQMLGDNRQRAVTLFAVIALAAVLIPSYLFADTLIGGLKDFKVALDTGTYSLPRPREGVREWPLVGERLYTAWQSAAADTGAWLSANAEQIRGIAGKLMSKLAHVGVAVLQFVLSIVIATLMLAHAAAGEAAVQRFFTRLLGDDQAQVLLSLSAATVRSVAVGVLGIAAIQALGAGLGLVAVGVPAAGLLALIVLVLAIAQLPPWLVLIPVAVYVFSEHSTTVAVLFLIWSLIVSFADMFLKPLLLGRGVEAPMSVILLGAIGGMLLSGIIGLFTGSVLLALAYKLFQAWLNDPVSPPPTRLTGR